MIESAIFSEIENTFIIPQLGCHPIKSNEYNGFLSASDSVQIRSIKGSFGQESLLCFKGYETQNVGKLQIDFQIEVNNIPYFQKAMIYPNIQSHC